MVENHNSDKAEQENVDDSQKCCPSTSGDNTCCSSASGSYSKRKLVVLVIIVVAAGIILARSLMKESTAVSDDTQQLFAAIAQENCETSPQTNAVTNIETSEETELTLWRAELDSLASLNKVATNTDVVFVLLAADDQQGNQAITREIEAAAKKIKSKGNRVCAFKLKKDAPDYAQLAKQFSIPCVVAMVKGRGMSAVSGEINETRLIGAFVTASRPSGCCPSGAGQSACPPTGPRK